MNMMTDNHEQKSNGAPNGTHMPPLPLPQLNTNPGSNTLGADNTVGMGSPTSAGGSVRRAAPEPNKRALYVGGLKANVTEDMLRQIFQTAGLVQNVKIIPDKNHQARGLNYGFIEFEESESAERAMQSLNGRTVLDSEIRVNWAYQSTSSTKEDTSNHFHIFVGDLSNEVNDGVLLQAFSAFGSVSEGRVMWDMKTGRSRGYGFVAFRDRSEAERALAAMDGEWLGSRAIRCNWANQKGQPSMAQHQAMMQVGMAQPQAFGQQFAGQGGRQSYETILGQAPAFQTTCYVGNLTPYTTQNDLIPLFSQFGYVTETRFQSDRGFAFVKMDTHEHAAAAISQLTGYSVNGRPLKCSWGKDRPTTAQFDGFSPQAPQSATFTPAATNFFPQYGGASGPMSPQGHNGVAQFPQFTQGANAYAGVHNNHQQHQQGQQQNAYGRAMPAPAPAYAYNGNNHYGGYQT